MANNLMPRDQRQFRIRQFTVDDVKVSATNSARTYAHEQLSLPRPWLWHVAQLQRLVWLIEDHRSHGYQYNDESQHNEVRRAGEVAVSH
jgi:hypothetical protein